MTYSLPSYNNHEQADKMPLKAVVLSLAATILQGGDTSIAESLDADL